MSGTLTLLAALVGLLSLSVPLFVVIGVVTVLGYVLFADVPSVMDVALIERMRELTSKPPLLAIPFFVLSGAVMSNGGIAERLVRVARAAFRRVPGGLGIATVAACMFFAAISGSSPVTVITIGGVMYPALVKAGYSGRFSTGLVTSAGTLGILIPPSIPMIVYAIFASGTQVIQVEELFLAGIGPGLIIGLVLAGYCFVTGVRLPAGARDTEEGLRLGPAIADGFWALMLPVVILGGIYSGIFTATEAAVVSVVYSLVVELVIHRELKLADVPSVVAEATILMGSLLVIFGMAVALNALLTDLQIPDAAANWLMGLDLTPFTFLLLLNGFLLLVGCLMDIMSAIMILVPLLAPLAALCGVDPIHLGVVFIVNLELGYLTPPMGLNLFVSSSIFGQSLGSVIRSVVPFTLLLLGALLVVTYVPTVSMGPVNALKGRPFYVAFPEGGTCEAPPSGDEPPLGAPVEEPAAAGASIGDLMESDAYQDALGDDEADDDGAKSLQELMESDAYEAAFEDDEAPAEEGGAKSLQELMRDPAYREAFEEE